MQEYLNQVNKLHSEIDRRYEELKRDESDLNNDRLGPLVAGNMYHELSVDQLSEIRERIEKFSSFLSEVSFRMLERYKKGLEEQQLSLERTEKAAQKALEDFNIAATDFPGKQIPPYDDVLADSLKLSELQKQQWQGALKNQSGIISPFLQSGSIEETRRMLVQKTDARRKELTQASNDAKSAREDNDNKISSIKVLNQNINVAREVIQKFHKEVSEVLSERQPKVETSEKPRANAFSEPAPTYALNLNEATKIEKREVKKSSRLNSLGKAISSLFETFRSLPEKIGLKILNVYVESLNRRSNPELDVKSGSAIDYPSFEPPQVDIELREKGTWKSAAPNKQGGAS